ncbi:ABC1 kinase family protein [Nocardia sp. GCM10030253]|uniref:ABC1 kinase family protein n=1 Tax=Nocardia sp. GCM10030253 TaxID=3273404 RepID=UPI00363BF51B
MSDRIRTSRIGRGSTVGRYAARQAVRNARARFARMTRPSNPDDEAAAREFLRATDELVDMLGGMKGAAMKVGQMLSIIDLAMIPRDKREHFQQRLAVLRDSAPAFAFDQMRRVMEDDLGGSLDTLFAEFDTEPIASASIGQVYRARLPDGSPVAVKVQYPGIASAVRADLKNLALLLRLSKPLLPTASTDSFIEELTFHIGDETDYLREANTQHEMATHYAGHPFITVPDAVLPLCGPRVLVTEYIDGMRFDEIAREPADVRNRVAEIIYRFYIGSIYLDCQFNGDPHPGNLLLTSDGRVAFLDFGLFKRMDPTSVDFERKAADLAFDERADALHALLRTSGVLGPAAPITPEQTLEYFYDASPWTFDDEDLEVTGELAGGALMTVADPRSAAFGRMHRQTLPPEHFFARRADFYAFGMIGQLRGTANWHRMAREWVRGDAPATELGVADTQWRAGRYRAAGACLGP